MGANKKEKLHLCPHNGCKSAFNRPYRLAQHILVHNNVKPYVCKEGNCTKSYTNKSHLDRHMNNAHKQIEKDTIHYSCPTCMKEYNNRQNLKRHIKIKHVIKVAFTCDACKIDYKKKHQLSAHMYYHTGVCAFSCNICSKEFKNIVEKKKHMRQHKIFNCEKCPQKFSQWSKYQHHFRITHVPKEYHCNDCGRIFKQRAHIIRHVKQHTNTSFQCPYESCNRFYSNNFNLSQHIQIKHENKKHPCDLCDAHLATKAKLKEHLSKIHLQTRSRRKPKTKETGRKTRKDFEVPKVSMALKLSGLTDTNIKNNNDILETETFQKIL